MLHKTPPAGYVRRKMLYSPYSPSRLITAKCPQRFFGQYVRKDKNVGFSVNSARGSAIHLVFSQITEAKLKGISLTPVMINDWVAAAVGQFPASYEQITLIREAVDAYIANPNPYVNQTTASEKEFAVALYEEQSFADDEVLGRAFVEVPYSIDGKTNPEVFFGGKLDQITVDEEIKTITILDHKTTPSANENEDHNFQVGAYAWLVSLFYPGYKVRTVIHYAHPRLNFYAPPVYWDYEDLQTIQSIIMSKVMAIEAMSDFDAIPGNGCDYCHMVQECRDYLKVCEQKARGAIDLNVRSTEDLLRLAQHLRTIEAMKDEVHKALKQGIESMCPQNGIALPGIWYGFKVSDESVDWIATDIRIREEAKRAQEKLSDPGSGSESERAEWQRVADLGSLEGILSQHGVNPNHFKKWTADKLKNIWRLDKPELVDELAKFVVKDRSTRFGAHKG